MAGTAGLEPADEGVKVPCLTTWLRPNLHEFPQGPDANGNEKGKKAGIRDAPRFLCGVGDGT